MLHAALAPLIALSCLMPADAPVELKKVSFDGFFGRLAKPDPGVKLTVVDAWATYCQPCKENFPHLVELSHRYGNQGLRVMSLSMDDPSDPDAVREAEAFLKGVKATFGNYLIDADPGEVYERMDIVAIPAVFVFGPDGKELKRFTLDDPDNQFTYEQVEQYIKGELAGAR